MSEMYSGHGVAGTHVEPGVRAWPYTDYESSSPASVQPSFPPFAPLDASWDPAEELAYLLRDQAAAESAAFPPEPAVGESGEEMPTAERLAGLAQVTEELTRVRPVPGHRRVTPRKPALSALQKTSYLIVAMAAVVVSMVSVLGGVITYDPLRRLPGPHAAYGAGGLWPLLVYGPWTVATLSILRAALHRRRAAHSWSVVLFFSGVTMLLCIAEAPRTIPGVATAALPSLAALACFQQLVRQITLTRPPRKTVRRHRTSTLPFTPYRPPQQKTGA
ncbi:DUF2637 domain-containing protein [Streptomyces sp. NPDC046862]|uniref:DUF2637 domain-containing protein n=1 Tax=Streptomyces sp. NPDC046862 TaxID=3154603 RepID=UPI0034569950